MTSLVKMSGVTRRRERVGKQLLSLNGNPIDELRQAPQQREGLRQSAEQVATQYLRR